MPRAHRGRDRRYLALLSGAVLVGSLFSVVPAVTRGSSTEGQIAFVRSQPMGGDSDIWVVNANGTSETQLTAGSARDESPAWSPDGSTLAFARTIGTTTSIWLIDADGSNLRPLNIQSDVGQFVAGSRPHDWHGSQLLATLDYYSDSCGFGGGGGPNQHRLALVDVVTGATQYVAGGGCFSHAIGHATFSPDGTKVAYEQNFGFPQVYRYDVALGTSEPFFSNAYAPDWSPVDDRIAFVDPANANVAIREISGEVSYHALGGSNPHWAPDGSGIAVSAPGGGGGTGSVIRVFDFGDLSTKDVTSGGEAHDSDPAWAPGSVTATPPTPPGPGKIAYASNADGNYEIYGINDDGTHLVRLTTHAARDENPVWSPDGERIAFASDRDGMQATFVMNADGTDLHRLDATTSFGGVSNFVPTDWSRDGTQLVGTGQVFNSFCSGGFGNPVSQALLVDIDSGAAEPLSGSPCTVTYDGTINHDGNEVAWVQNASSGPGSITAVHRRSLGDFSQGEQVTFDMVANDPTFNPVDDRIAYLGDNGQIRIVGPGGSTQSLMESGTAIDWSPDGQAIVTGRSGGFSWEIQAISLVGEPSRTIATFAGNGVSGVSWASGQMVDLAPEPSEEPSPEETPQVSEEPSEEATPMPSEEPSPEPTSDPDQGGDEGALFNIEAGGTQTTDFNSDGARPGDPLEVNVTTPNAGGVGIQESSTPTQSPAPGYQLLGQEVAITAPPATVAQPLIIDFVLDGSLVAGTPSDRLAVQRNGVKVPACLDLGGASADPDPCVLAWQSGIGDDVVLSVRAATASTWNILAGLPIDPESVTAAAPAGGSVTTDDEGDGASAGDPLETTVETPIGGTITIEESDPFGAAPSGWDFVGQQVEITADPATPEDPLILTFRLDASLLPAGSTAATVQLFRDGALIVDCDPGADGAAVPDPCIALRTLLPDGDVSLTARSSHASAWNLGIYVAQDATAPSIQLDAPADGAVYLLGANVVADYRCLDGVSGVVGCVGTRPDGAPLPTGTVGTHTFEVVARDAAGNSSLRSVTYSVVYAFAGWLSPVDNRPTLNRVKAGSAVPVKFTLGGDHGLGVLAAGYPKVATMDCTASTVDLIETVMSSSANSGLSYDAASDTYQYVWKTQKGWANSCRVLVVRLADGTDHMADFSFVK